MMTRRHAIAATGGLVAAVAGAAAQTVPAQEATEQWKSNAAVRSRPARDRRMSRCGPRGCAVPGGRPPACVRRSSYL